MIHYPPKPLFTLTLGITGHRLHRDPKPGGENANRGPELDVNKVRTGIDNFLDALAGAIADIRAEAANWFDPAAATIALVSSLAEGSDRIAAEAVLARHLMLDVVLPCQREIYETSFADSVSRDEFAALLKQARACLILPPPKSRGRGEKMDLAPAYEAAGLTMLAQADILLAVWDGEPSRGRGGTADIVDVAAQQNIPIVVIDPVDGKPRLLWCGNSFPLPATRAQDVPVLTVERNALADVVRAVVSPPMSRHERAGLEMFLKTHGRSGDENYPAEKFTGRLGANGAVSNIDAVDRLNRTAATRLLAAFTTAGQIAQMNARFFRTAFVCNFILGAAAAGCIAISSIRDDWHAWLVVVELVFIVSVVILASVAVREQWHRRWFEAREVAERLRVAEPFWMLGVWPHNLTPTQTSWPGWYARAILRSQPLFSGDITHVLKDAKATLSALIDDQRRYHAHTATARNKYDNRLAVIGHLCVFGLVVNAVLFLIAYWARWHGLNCMKPYNLAAAIFLPAAAAAAYGIRLFGDYEDIVRRSQRTGEALLALRRLLDDDPDDLATLRARAGQAAATMLSDLEAWRVAVESRYLAAS